MCRDDYISASPQEPAHNISMGLTVVSFANSSDSTTNERAAPVRNLFFISMVRAATSLG